MSRVRWIQIEPTTACNLKCEFCYGRSMAREELDVASFRELLGLFPDLIFLHLQGEGEPFLAAGMLEMAALAAQRGVLTLTTTNGTLLSASRARDIVDSGIASILFSIESADPAEFRRLRGFDLGKLIKGIQTLQATKVERGSRAPALGFAVTVLRSTKERLPEIFALHRSLGMDGHINVRYLQKTPGYDPIYGPEMRAELLDDSEVARTGALERELLELHFGGPLPPTHPFPERLADLEAILAASPGCYWLESGLYVDADGELGPCCNVKKHVLRFGHHRHTTLAEVEERREAMQRELVSGEIPKACRGCLLAESIRRRKEGAPACLRT